MSYVLAELVSCPDFVYLLSGEQALLEHLRPHLAPEPCSPMGAVAVSYTASFLLPKPIASRLSQAELAQDEMAPFILAVPSPVLQPSIRLPTCLTPLVCG